MNKNSIIATLVVIATIAVGVLISFSSDSGKKKTSSKTDTKAELIREGAYYKGNKDAKVVIVEFSDFQCPACKLSEPELKKITDYYGDKIVFYYRHFPLAQHPFSDEAAEAAEAAGIQGKFWEMHDLIFENQEKLTADSFESFAQQLGLDLSRYKSDTGSAEIKSLIKGDTATGKNLGVSGTPTFFLNGVKTEARTFDEWKVEIDKRL